MPSSSSNRPRLLIVTRNYPPLVGGMERLLHRASLELVQQFDIALCGPTGSSAFAPRSARVTEVTPLPLWKFMLRSLYASLLLARRWRPDIVLAGSGLTALAVHIVGRACGAQTAIYVHGLDLVARNPIYRHLFLPAIRKGDLIVANSESTRRLAADAGVDARRIRVLNPGVAIPDEPDRTAIMRFRARLGIANRPILLSVGRLTPRKGLAEFIESSLPAIVADVPGAIFLVVGEPARNAAAGGASGVLERIELAVNRQGLEKHVLILGSVDDETLNLAFSAASVLVFPVIEVPGDIEGVGMVAVEAAAHGVPTVAFRVGGLPDAVDHGVSGFLVEIGRYDEFAEACRLVLNGAATFPAARRFATGFAWPAFGEKFRRLLAELVTDNPRH
jgi:phosphatidyl-myo-inositol dimannoside synthase